MPSVFMNGDGGYSQADWNERLQQMDGDLLQSWQWGKFKQCHGWRVERLYAEGSDGPEMAQVLFRQRGWFTLAYVPRGPVLAGQDTRSSELLPMIDESCVRNRSIVLVLEPKQPLPPGWRGDENGFVSGPEPFQASRTVKLQLAPEDELLAQMRKDTRYNIQRARRHGVIVDRAPIDASSMETFYQLLLETSQRNGFRIHPRSYYEDFLRVFDDQAILLFSHVDGVITAGLIAARFGIEGRSMYAGSSSAHRSRGDTALLRFEATRWARHHGCHRYDLGGIGPERPPDPVSRPDLPSGRGQSDLDGVKHFKVGFGGDIIAYPTTVERRYRPGMAWVVRNFHSRFRTAPPG